MSSTEFDMPLNPSAEQIRRREFVTIRRGYDPDQVRAYLRQVGDQIESLEGQLETSKAEIASLMRTRAQVEPADAASAQRIRDDAYSQLSERMADILRTADRHAEEIRQEGEEEVRRMIAEARAEADDIRVDSQAKAEEVRRKAEELMRGSRNHADRLVLGISSRRSALELELEELEEMLERMEAMVRSIDGIEQEVLEKPQTGTDPESTSESPVPPVLKLPESPLAPSDRLLTESMISALWSDESAAEPTLEDVDPEEPSF